MSKKSELKEKAAGGDAQAKYELAVAYYDAFLPRRKTAVMLWTEAAAQNHILSQYRLGEAYRLGKGAKRDSKTALGWYEKAAGQGNAAAHYQAGMMYRYGDGGDIDLSLEKAVSHWTAAANKGYAKAQCELGRCYYDGVGVELDYNAALDWYNKALAQNEPTAMIAMGDCYRYGRGVACNTDEAVKLYTQAANNHCVEGWTSLGDLYLCLPRDGFCLDDIFEYTDPRENKKYYNDGKAHKFYKKAAAYGSARAQTMLYYYQFANSKVLPPKQENKRDGYVGIQVLAEKGSVDAQYLLGMIYEEGDMSGVCQIKQDIALAKKWYAKACKQGYAAAMYRLALANKDANTRTYWTQRGADFGNMACASMLNTTEGTPTDFHYTRLAYERGAGLISYGVYIHMAWLYLKGAGTARNEQKAREFWYKVPKDVRTNKHPAFETEINELQAYFGRN